MWYLEIYYASGKEELLFFPTREFARMHRSNTMIRLPATHITLPQKAD